MIILNKNDERVQRICFCVERHEALELIMLVSKSLRSLDKSEVVLSSGGINFRVVVVRPENFESLSSNVIKAMQSYNREIAELNEQIRRDNAARSLIDDSL
jgi:hypothetical protein